MSGFALVAEFDEVRVLGFASITTSYVAVTPEFDHIVRIMKFVNTTDTDLYVSFDGSVNRDIVPALGFCLYDFTSDGPSGTEFVKPKGTQVYVKSAVGPTVPASGRFYVVCIYGKGE